VRCDEKDITHVAAALKSDEPVEPGKDWETRSWYNGQTPLRAPEGSTFAMPLCDAARHVDQRSDFERMVKTHLAGEEAKLVALEPQGYVTAEAQAAILRTAGHVPAKVPDASWNSKHYRMHRDRVLRIEPFRAMANQYDGFAEAGKIMDFLVVAGQPHGLVMPCPAHGRSTFRAVEATLNDAVRDQIRTPTGTPQELVSRLALSLERLERREKALASSGDVEIAHHATELRETIAPLALAVRRNPQAMRLAREEIDPHSRRLMTDILMNSSAKAIHGADGNISRLDEARSMRAAGANRQAP
jgi:hypothetical protein